jgi:hypothetical protein
MNPNTIERSGAGIPIVQEVFVSLCSKKVVQHEAHSQDKEQREPCEEPRTHHRSQQKPEAHRYLQ